MGSPHYEKWKNAQSHWDDEDFLKSLTALMRLRYKRLDEKVYGVFEAFKQKRFSEPGNNKQPLLADIGCGRSEFGAFLKAKWDKDASLKNTPWNYLGIEPSMEQLKHRDIDTLGWGFIQALGEQVPLPDMSCDGVLVKEALDHCYDPLGVFREAGRILRPGGVLVVTLTNDKSYFKRLFPGINRKLKEKQTDHLFFFGPKDLEKLAAEARFDSIRAQTYNYLKLPRFLEKLMGFLGEPLNGFLLDLTDGAGEALLPGLGGGILLKAFKK